MRVTFDTKKRAKPRGQAEPEHAAARRAHAEQSAGARSGMPLFLRERLGGGASAAPPALQTKLIVGEPRDEYEREADLAAQLAASASPVSDSSHHGRADDELFVQPKLQANARASAKALDTIVGPAGSGTSLPPAIRHRVEPLLGVDLGDVRVHTDAAAHSSARRLEAKAFTHQNHIWLGPHQSADDIELMAHELTHVVQQTGRDAPPQTLQREPEEESDGDAVQRRLQERIDEALGERSAARHALAAPDASAPRAASRATPAPATEDPQARQAAREVDRAAVRERARELQEEAQPDIDRAAEQQPQVEQAARATVQSLERPPGQQGQGAGAAARQGEGAPAAPQQQQAPGAARDVTGAPGAAASAGRAAAALQQAAGAASEAFSSADSVATPDSPEIVVPPPEIAPVDAGGQPLAGDPETDARVIELANDAQHVREQGQSLREQAAEGAANAQILRGNAGLVNEGITGSEGGLQTAGEHLTFRRGLVEQARSALGVSERKAADVAAGAPRGGEQSNENK